VLRLLGPRIIPRAAIAYLILAIVLLSVGFIIHLVGVAIDSGVASTVAILVLITGAASGVMAARKAWNNPDR